ncbi:MAG TPA: ABC transporter ATP-binding protein [Mycobacteriales bacterium]|nr:ABC transporter ATP-binding protein [Mycobacteriales bacterium]
MIEARAVDVRFDGVHALAEVDLALAPAEIVGLIGPNGAGKTTLVNAVSGFQRPTAGTIRLDGTDITGWPAHRRARAGVGRTFQSVRAFGALTVRENLEAGAYAVGRSRRAARALADETLELVGLTGAAGTLAGALAYGQERRLGIARALAAGPRFLLLDEPAAGLNEAETDDLLDLLRHIRAERGCGLLVIEHDMRLIMRLCERLQVLDHGRTIAAGSPAEVAGNQLVLAAYLGQRDSRQADERGGHAAG